MATFQRSSGEHIQCVYMHNLNELLLKIWLQRLVLSSSRLEESGGRPAIQSSRKMDNRTALILYVMYTCCAAKMHKQLLLY